MKVKLSPSLMCMDLLNIEKEVRILAPQSDYFHIDILDWHYARNMSLAPCFMEVIKNITDVPMEAHLYIDNVDTELVQLCIDSGAEYIILPPEVVNRQVMRLIQLIHNSSKKVGFFINPGTRLDIIEPYIEYIDRVIINTVDPGFAAQPFAPNALRKIEEARQWRATGGYHYDVACDGCCNEKYYAALYNAGAEEFIVGSTGLFGKDLDTAKALAICVEQINAALG